MKRMAKALFPVSMLLLVCGFGPCSNVALNDPTTAPDLSPGDSTPARGDGGVGTNSLVYFNPDIQNDINNLGCATNACHGGTAPASPPLLVANPTTVDEEFDNYTYLSAYYQGQNYDAAAAASSPLMLNVTGHDGHAGGALMQVGDPTYNRWITWIAAGGWYIAQ